MSAVWSHLLSSVTYNEGRINTEQIDNLQSIIIIIIIIIIIMVTIINIVLL